MKSEKILQILFASIAVFAIVTMHYFWWFAKPSTGCPLDNSDAWCDVHPFTTSDAIGMAILHFAFSFVFGNPMFARLRDKIGAWFYFGVVVLAGIGWLLIIG